MNSNINIEMNLKICNFFRILGDLTRLRIISVLDNKELCVNDIAYYLDMTKSAISHQLALLKENGLVRCYKKGKEVYYTLDDEHVQLVYEIANEHIKHKEEKNEKI